MHTATLMDIDSASGVCTYKLSGCGYYDAFIFGKDRKELEVFSREGFTKISLNGREVVKTLGVMSHKNTVEVQAFMDKVNTLAADQPEWLEIFNNSFLDTLNNTVKILEDKMSSSRNNPNNKCSVPTSAEPIRLASSVANVIACLALGE